MNNATLHHQPTIYTTGAYLSPIKVTVDGKPRWMWVVIDFSDDSFKDGEVFNPPESAETATELLTNTTGG